MIEQFPLRKLHKICHQIKAWFLICQIGFNISVKSYYLKSTKCLPRISDHFHIYRAVLQQLPAKQILWYYPVCLRYLMHAEHKMGKYHSDLPLMLVVETHKRLNNALRVFRIYFSDICARWLHLCDNSESDYGNNVTANGKVKKAKSSWNNWPKTIQTSSNIFPAITLTSKRITRLSHSLKLVFLI